VNKLNDKQSLTLDEKIGQLFMFGFDALEVNDHAIELIKEYKVGNVILFTRNVKTPEQLFTLNQNLQKLAYDHIGIPLLISIDQEGGMVTRIHNGGTFFPGAMTTAATHDSNNAYLSGKYMGEELKSFGINMNFAPVLDVNNNPENPVIGVRSYSDDPKMVTEYGVAFMKGMQESIIATGKHFPGHGDTHVDSHLALPKVDHPMERLERIELAPFKKAIKSGLKAIMSSHIDFPALTENNLPTTLSKKCMTDFLRGTLGFEGLIVTDGMQMKAIQDNYTTVEASLMAIEAGVNIVCICHARDLQIKAVKRVKEAVENGTLSEAVIDERVNRVLEYKAALDPIDFNQTFEDIKPVVFDQYTKEFALNTVRNALTLVKGNPLVLSENALFIGVSPKATTIADEADLDNDVIEQIKKEFPSLKTHHVTLNPSDDMIESIKEQAQGYDQIILTTYNANNNKQQIKLIDALNSTDKDFHVIAMRNPYDLYYTDNIPNFVTLYEYTPNSIKVLLEYLKSDLKPTGKLPVHYV